MEVKLVECTWKVYGRMESGHESDNLMKVAIVLLYQGKGSEKKIL